MEAIIGPEIVKSYKRLSYKIWYALAEFVDNSTQAYFNNQKVLDSIFTSENIKLKIEISTGVDDEHGPYIDITDNSIGMNLDDLKYASQIGKPPKISDGRSKYGLGMKTAASWIGDNWVVITKKLNDDKVHNIEFDIERIASGKLDLNYESESAEKSSHFTTIRIYKLNRVYQGKTIRKIRDYLASMYRHDLNTFGLELVVFGETLSWDEDEKINNDLRKNENDEPFKRSFDFKILGKDVKGWAGVFEDGGRPKAGFSLIQSNRVIQDWNPGYRPAILFGDQEGGRNDLVNQRLVGELYLDGFAVSHTKDEIMFTDEEEDQLEYFLNKELADYKKEALNFRKKDIKNIDNIEELSNSAVAQLSHELRSSFLIDSMTTVEPIPIDVIQTANEILLEKIRKEFSPSFDIIINNIHVILYVVAELSVYEPYLTIQARQEKDSVIIIVNRSHTYWDELTTEESILNFLRHCVYDGVAEWKAAFVANNLDPDSIKSIKDNLLRVPFEMKSK